MVRSCAVHTFRVAYDEKSLKLLRASHLFRIARSNRRMNQRALIASVEVLSC